MQKNLKLRKNISLEMISKYWFLYLIMILTLIFYTVFKYYPIIVQTVCAFKEYRLKDGIWGSQWVGFKNFSDLISMPDISRLIKNTVGISVLRMLVGFFPPIILAIFIFDIKGNKFKKISQTILYLPHFFSWVIVYSIVFAIFNNTGLINSFLEFFGGEKVNFLQSREWFRPMLIGSALWKDLGWGTIIYLAALSGIDTSLYEAAKIDGAGPIQRIRYITLPGIASVVIFFLTLNIGGLFTNAGTEQILLFYSPATWEVADVIDTWIFRNSLGGFEYSLGATLGFVQAVISLVLVLIANKIAIRTSGRGLW